MFASYGGFAASYVGIQRIPVVRRALRIAPQAAGAADGSSWANAAPLSALNSMIGQAALLGAEVWLRADDGPYTLPTSPIVLDKGGTAGAPVTVRGVDVNGADMQAVLVGTRQSPRWQPGGATGGEQIWINTGAAYLRLTFLHFIDAGTCIRLRQATSDLTFEDITGSNIRRLIQNSGTQADIARLTIRRCQGYGFSKHFIIVRYDSHDVLIEDCYGDAEKQDGDQWSQGIALDDIAHDVTIRRCTMKNCYYDAGAGYWNGDGFVGERGNYRILIEDCVSTDNTDGGYDFKSQIVLRRCRAERNKRNFRMWGYAELYDCIGIDPTNYGGSGSSGHVYGYDDSRVRVHGGRWSTATGNTPFHAFQAGFIAVDQAAIDATTGNFSQLFVGEGGGDDAQYVTLDYTDATPPVIQKVSDEATGTVFTPAGGAIAIAKDENKPMSFFVQVSEPCTLRATGQNADRINPEGRRLLVKAQDYEAAGGAAGDGTNVLKFNLIATDANGNDSAPLACRLTINDVADDAIGPAEAFAYAGADGLWIDIADSSTLYADVAMTVPAQVGDAVLAVRDKSGAGRHLTQPDPDQAAILRRDAGLQYLAFDGTVTNYRMGAPGEFRFAQFTAFAAFQRDADAGDGKGALIFFGRRSTSASSSSNGTFWMMVQDASFASWRRTGGSTSGIDGGAPKKKGVVLSVRNSDGAFRYNGGTLTSDSSDSDGNTYPTFSDQPLVGARLDETGLVSFFKGRLYALAVQNRSTPDDVRFRIERQLGSSAGAAL